MSVVLSLSVVVMFIGSRIGKKDTTIAVVFLCFFVYMFRIDQNVRSCACVCVCVCVCVCGVAGGWGG
jgi:hypothetical protein